MDTVKKQDTKEASVTKAMYLGTDTAGYHMIAYSGQVYGGNFAVESPELQGTNTMGCGKSIESAKLDFVRSRLTQEKRYKAKGWTFPKPLGDKEFQEKFPGYKA